MVIIILQFVQIYAIHYYRLYNDSIIKIPSYCMRRVRSKTNYEYDVRMCTVDDNWSVLRRNYRCSRQIWRQLVSSRRRPVQKGFFRFITQLLPGTGPICSSFCSHGNILLKCNYGCPFLALNCFRNAFLNAQNGTFLKQRATMLQTRPFSILRLNVRS